MRMAIGRERIQRALAADVDLIEADLRYDRGRIHTRELLLHATLRVVPGLGHFSISREIVPALRDLVSSWAEPVRPPRR